ncbi:hypothetical protein PY092_09090 [Muricauda sp. 334s03]|uniref:Uncharacterized protein n=1 Tax=Flagellimonas yonaguniensis TaxID=3031325 RepID=A0ABT5XYN3_9FLAO|nr:hypothetical protein [[Muricauda] yonaguniensis]MDF0716300.1 hypothetical protein [[Muricauda] yonaguniensis]
MQNWFFLWNMTDIRTSTFDLRILFIALLAGMLLVAPCKVRNSLEHSLGLEKSEVSNKLKTTVSTKSCVSYGIAQQTEGTFTNVLGMVTPVLPVVPTPNFHSLPNSEDTVYVTAKQSLVSNVPFYILYRQFKVYS